MRNLKTGITILLISAMTFMLFACGGKSDSSPTALPTLDSEQPDSEGTNEETIEEPEVNSVEDEDAAKENGQDFDLDLTDGFDKSFSVYDYYEPSDKVKNATTHDGCFIQIGDRVLELRKSTIRDFVNAGVDLYDIRYEDYASRDEDVNLQRMEYVQWSEFDNTSVTGYLGDYLRIDIFCMPEDIGLTSENDPLDTPVTSVNVELAKEGLNLTENIIPYIHSDEFVPINSLYINGGHYIKETVDEVDESFGSISLIREGDSEGLHYCVRNIINKKYESDPGLRNLVQLDTHDYMLTSFFLSTKD